MATEPHRLHDRSIQPGVGANDFLKPLSWSARAIFGHLYKSVHLIDEHHVAAVYTSPVGRCLSGANVLPFVVDTAPTNSLLLRRECATESTRRLGK